MFWRGIQSFNSVSGGIEGSVAGDTFRFNQTSGTDVAVNGEPTVAGDDMDGIVHFNGRRNKLHLGRLDSSRPSVPQQ